MELLNTLQGDGYFCKKSVIGCNIINSCSKYADCLFDYEEHGYRFVWWPNRLRAGNAPFRDEISGGKSRK